MPQASFLAPGVRGSRRRLCSPAHNARYAQRALGSPPLGPAALATGLYTTEGYANLGPRATATATGQSAARGTHQTLPHGRRRLRRSACSTMHFARLTGDTRTHAPACERPHLSARAGARAGVEARKRTSWHRASTYDESGKIRAAKGSSCRHLRGAPLRFTAEAVVSRRKTPSA